ncbi:hypothetical protein Moror_6603 [Moniliophthora roreri MCA 2997]|uniref:Mitotic checkpoint regulator, MAD2B-interacting-domain-containing protein n=1 Tax=Moniliophthora roreri (strain MCA 2997) TaxID=1381753 RepID=V2XWS7_MONRO|nr:hypothetical protein Moror_6603 [Moniliophthora roreri MCA 2997]
MLGLEGYGSGSDSDDNTLQAPPPKLKKPTTTVKSSSSLSLPAPSGGTKAKRKVAIGLPELKPAENEDQVDDGERAAKKPRLEAGAGRSSLLSMLPAPKQKAPVLPAPERVLGAGKGPGLVFNARPAASAPHENGEEAQDDDGDEGSIQKDNSAAAPPSSTSSSSVAFLPPSLKKGRSNISLEEGKSRAPPRTVPSKPAAPAVDFFSLGSSSTSPAPNVPSSPSSSVTISSAPDLPTFEPPEPSMNDPYPGYYQLPSGQWAAHDPVVYEKFRKKWENEYNAHVRALEKGTAKGFEAYDRGDVEEVDAAKEMEKAKEEIKEREERKAITKTAQGAPEKPKMNITASKMSGVARSRHQLATMLNEAYMNREALEEKIAEGRRNRKEAGNKYGTSQMR